MPTGENVARKPGVVIVGRPNVGKSTLFNRLVGQRNAIVEDIPGTTRDRLQAEVAYRDRHFALMDTGGLEPNAEEGYSALIRRQVETAVREADVVLFVVDTVAGGTRHDLEVAGRVRRIEEPIMLLGNKGGNVGLAG